eukprot:scaffold2917_cov191-Amphora_coffeaeformis.AAC.45
MKGNQWLRPLIWTAICNQVTSSAGSSTATLHNGVALPLVGLGVGNLAPQLLAKQIPIAVGEYGYQLIDTAHASQNEDDIRKSLSNAATRNATAMLRRSSSKDAEVDNQHEIHIVTKVWYTHLGYARTLISAKESWEALKMSDNTTTPALHMLLHWPRCRYDISWMHCEQEEANLPKSVKEAGLAPHLDPDHAFVESWRALEDLYEASSSPSADVPLVSIGVSNFDLDDLKLLEENARIMPHIIQLNVWAVVFDPHLMEYCQRHQIHVQVYNVMNGIVGSRGSAPNAFELLWTVAHNLKDQQSTGTGNITPAQVVMAWLTQQGISVIPRTGKTERLESNAPDTIAYIPELTPQQQDKVVLAVRALLTGRDLEPPTARFYNDHPSDVLHLFWLHSDTQEEVPVQLDLAPGKYFDTRTFPGHIFVAYNADKDQRREFTISASYGEEQEWVIDEL